MYDFVIHIYQLATIAKRHQKIQEHNQTMKHHFGDFLDRTGDYWTTIPNRERFAFIADFEIANKDEVKPLALAKLKKKYIGNKFLTTEIQKN